MNARQTFVQAAVHAPAMTASLAEFVAWHPSRGWGHESEQQAHRTLANRAGFAVGHSGQKTVGAALAAVQDLTTAAQASWFGRTGRNDLANAVMRNGIGPHIFDFDDTHFGDKA